MSEEIIHNNDYKDWSVFISGKIKFAQTQAALKVNAAMLTLYWEIGNSIIEKQAQNGWGSKIIDLLASDLAKNFPENKGFSVRNLKYMRAFAEAYPQFPIVQVPFAQSETEFVQVPLAQITWYHHISLLAKVKDTTERAFYIAETAKNEWSRDVMLLHIQSNLYERDGKALNNFERTLPEYQSDLAKSIFKDPYNFDFLMLSRKAREVEIEHLLTQKITDFLLELGKGFAFVGRQYKIEVDNSDYKIDLLFYHTVLHAYVVIELKAGEFLPEYVSKLNFYISAIDDKLKTLMDEPTIGLLLCASKSNIKVEYAMRGLTKPLGVASYELEQLVKENIDQLNEQESINRFDMITIYGIPNCNTIKKTRTWFEQHHIPYSFHDYRKEGISKKQLNNWCREKGWEKLLNKQSTSWRKLDPETQAGITSAAKAIAVLLEHPTLIRRPVIEKGGSIVQVGFDEEMMEEKFL